MNFGIDKAKIYFQQRFTKDLEEKTQHIPPQKIVEPKASIAGPALQGLAFCHEELSLKDMYLNLISASMNTDLCDNTHPAFIETIKQLTSIEAQLLPDYLGSDLTKVIGRVRYTNIDDHTRLFGHTHILDVTTGDTPYYDTRIPSFVDNWIRLGLVEVGYGKYLTSQEHKYEEIKVRNEYLDDTKIHHEKFKKELEKGYIRRTSFGEAFAHIVGIAQSIHPAIRPISSL